MSRSTSGRVNTDRMTAAKAADPEVLKRSVTREDAMPAQSGVLHFYFPLAGSEGPQLLPYWTPGRDWQLWQTIFRESQWANAISKAITKMAAKDWTIDSEVPARSRRAQDLLLQFDAGRGWVHGLAKHLQAFLLTDNGAFIEIVRAKGRIIGLVHLDTFRMTRTGDPDFPAIYRDRRGVEHVMKPEEVIALADMPDQAELWNGCGHCAAGRAYRAICRLEAIERYLLEKVTGSRVLGLHIVNGVSTRQIKDVITSAKEQRGDEGYVTYMGSVVMGAVDPTSTPSVASIPFAEVPDGFDAEKERRNAYLIYANAIGIDPQLLDPDLVATRALGTGAQSRVIAEKAEALGLASWDKQFTHELNEWVLDDKTTFAFQEKDLTETERRAAIFLNDATAVGSLVDRVIIKPEQARQLLVDNDELPREFIEEDTTVDESLGDEEKPTDEDVGEAVPTSPQVSRPASPVPAAITPEIVRQMIGKEVGEGLAASLADAGMDLIEKATEAKSSAAMTALRMAADALDAAAAEIPAAKADDDVHITVNVDTKAMESMAQASQDQAKEVKNLLGSIETTIAEIAGRPVVVTVEPDQAVGRAMGEVAGQLAQAAVAMRQASEREMPTPILNMPAPVIQMQFPDVEEELEVTSRDSQGRVKQATKRIRRKEQSQ